MAVVTGYEECGPPPSAVRPREFNRDIVFSQESDRSQAFSRRVVVTPGTAVMLTAHGLPEGRRIFTWLVLVGRAGGTAGSDMYKSRMSLGGAHKWIFTRACPQKIITLPGTYRFELEETDILDGENFLMEFMTWRLEDTPVPELLVS
ncbi:MAG: hypothetical protein LBQ79_00450 [Deltaproteobacteria bacterium]|jgi:hypothetical protein|nr:hypothetical protein [Deltaproteobacteria bacterium]